MKLLPYNARSRKIAKILLLVFCLGLVVMIVPRIVVRTKVYVDLNSVNVKEGERQLSLEMSTGRGIYCGVVEMAPKDNEEMMPDVGVEYTYKVLGTEIEEEEVIRTVGAKRLIEFHDSFSSFHIEIPGERFEEYRVRVSVSIKGKEEDLKSLDISLHLKERATMYDC